MISSCSPETNPVEHVRDEVRAKGVANRLFSTLDAVQETIKIGMLIWMTDDWYQTGCRCEAVGVDFELVVEHD